MSTLNGVAPNWSWDADPSGTGNGSDWEGWLSSHVDQFNDGVLSLKDKLEAAYEALVGNPDDPSKPGDPSDPAKLAAYQSALSEYNMFRMMQSNSAKNLADMQKQNARNLG